MCFLFMSKVQIGYGIPQLKPYLAVANLARQYDVIMLESHMPLSCVCPVMDKGFYHNIVKVVYGPTATYFDNVVKRFMINGKIDA